MGKERGREGERRDASQAHVPQLREQLVSMKILKKEVSGSGGA